MKKLLSILILLVLAFIPCLCQDFIFKWNFEPSLSKPYTVKIEKNNIDCYMVIKAKFSLDSLVVEVEQKDCDSVFKFLEKYDFPNYRIKNYGTKTRKYYDTKFLSDTNWVVINGDSLKLDQITAMEFKYDEEMKQYYIETERQIIRTDGHSYSGEYIESSLKKTFLILDSHVRNIDYELNQMIYSLLVKYDSKFIYRNLKNTIESDEIINH